VTTLIDPVIHEADIFTEVTHAILKRIVALSSSRGIGIELSAIDLHGAFVQIGLPKLLMRGKDGPVSGSVFGLGFSPRATTALAAALYETADGASPVRGLDMLPEEITTTYDQSPKRVYILSASTILCDETVANFVRNHHVAIAERPEQTSLRAPMCSIIPHPRMSNHEKLQQRKDIQQDFSVFYAMMSTELTRCKRDYAIGIRQPYGDKSSDDDFKASKCPLN
jgi:hypothetical protein